MEEKKKSRRSFISKFAPITFWGSLVVWGGALAKFTMPTLLPQESKKIKLGMPSDFPAGTTKAFEKERVILFSDDKGLFAISTTCTHLGCVVKWTGRGFNCPCHGSKFGTKGEIIQGPAPKGLEWHKIDKLPSGQIIIDMNKTVEAGTKEQFYV
jgi:cytochrome b6-f complex iron-sulfur subunit